ncbi:MAG TPA: hypothetical protein ENO20_07200, partial [Bacteroides sp.]|nr:hypothetical protein [Bacteroides sp.]
MKTTKKICVLTAGICLLMTCRPSVGGMPGDSFSGEDPPQWVQWIREFDLGSNMIIVQKGSSIQDAL